MATTVFAALHEPRTASMPTSRCTLYFAIDNRSTGVHLAPENASKVSSAAWAMPRISACGEASRMLRRPRCKAWSSLLCRITFELRDPSCRVDLEWAALGIRLHVEICRSTSQPRRHYVTACAPFFLPPEDAASDAALETLKEWLRRMLFFQKVHVELHLLSGATRVLKELKQGPLARSPLLQTTAWTWFEAARLRLFAHRDSDLGINTAFNTVSNIATGQNPYHLQVWVLTKCLLEQRYLTEWVLLVDVDEFFEVRANAVSTTISATLRALPAAVQQIPFCTLNHCRGGSVRWRPKSALRVGQRWCEWWGTTHAGVAVEKFRTEATCDPLDENKHVVPLWPTTKAGGAHDKDPLGQGWDRFTAARCRPAPPACFFNHVRGQKGNCSALLPPLALQLAH